MKIILFYRHLPQPSTITPHTDVSGQDRSARVDLGGSWARQLAKIVLFTYNRHQEDPMAVTVGLFLLSAATLLFEITLTRVFSIGQFHHFAFMIVSLALLGSGASGTFLTIFPSHNRRRSAQIPVLGSWGFALAVVASYVFINWAPFDSFRVAHDWRQGALLACHYLALAVPFFCSGMVTGLLLSVRPGQAGRTYAANLIGSAIGCLLAVVSPSLLAEEGALLLSTAFALAAAIAFGWRTAGPGRPVRRLPHAATRAILQCAMLALVVVAAWRPPTFLALRMSPYKSLSYLMLYPDAVRVFQRSNGFSRVDVVRSNSIRSLPGSGIRCSTGPPAQLALTVDGEDVSPISHISPGLSELPVTDCLLMALTYRLRPGAHALVLEPRGGFDVLVALAEHAQMVTAVEPNALVIQAVREQGAWAGNLYDDPRVRVVQDDGRAYVRRTEQLHDLIVLSLTAGQRTVTSGAYSLGEDYRYTVEAFEDYLAQLDDGGMLVVMRWLQIPPSESIRAFALAAEAIERTGGDAQSSLMALRSYQHMLILARRGPFTERELATVRAFAAERSFDLVYLPDLRPDEVNRYNILPEPVYSQACSALLSAESREDWYRGNAFNIRPPTDDRPFFGNFFKWRQAADALALAGHVWQPFGGVGYLVLLALLALAVVASGVLVLAPLFLKQSEARQRERPASAALSYFALLGVGFFFVEMPLLQRFVLFLAYPAYAMAAVLFALLLFSGIGSAISQRVPIRLALALLLVVVIAYALVLPTLFRAALSASLAVRLGIAVLALAPPGLLMGIPFPRGLARLAQSAPGLVSWAWGVNGAASVVASILATLLAFDLGFSAVLIGGALCYAGAWFTVRLLGPPLERPRL